MSELHGTREGRGKEGGGEDVDGLDRKLLNVYRLIQQPPMHPHQKQCNRD